MKLLPVLVTITVILLLLHRAAPSSASLLPSFFHTRRGSSDSGVATTGNTGGGGGPLYDHFPSRDILNPFFALEHLPFGLDLALPYPPSAARVDWKETPEAHVVKVDAPGLGPGDLTVEVEEDSRVLRISGERKREEHKEGERWHIVERVVEERFSRQIRLPADADLGSVSARLKDGVLTVIVGKQDPGNVKQGPRVVAIDIDGLAANEQDNVRKIEGQSRAQGRAVTAGGLCLGGPDCMKFALSTTLVQHRSVNREYDPNGYMGL